MELKLSPVRGKFYVRKVSKHAEKLTDILKPSTSMSQRDPYTTKTVTELFSSYIIPSEGYTSRKRQKSASSPNTSTTVTKNVMRSYKSITNFQDLNKESVSKMSKRLASLTKGKHVCLHRKYTKLYPEAKVRDLVDDDKKEVYKLLDNIAKVHKIEKSADVNASSSNKLASNNLITEVPSDRSPRRKFKRNIILKMISGSEATANQSNVAYQENDENQRIKNKKASCSMVSDCQELEELRRVRDFRKLRIKRIYEHVLHKTGKKSARYLYRDYFSKANDMLAYVRRLEIAVGMKQPIKTSRTSRAITNLKKEQDPKKPDTKDDSIKTSRNQKFKRCLTAAEKRTRTKSYGKWYLRPNQFNTLLN